MSSITPAPATRCGAGQWRASELLFAIAYTVPGSRRRRESRTMPTVAVAAPAIAGPERSKHKPARIAQVVS
jgi:hypothetical protein